MSIAKIYEASILAQASYAGDLQVGDSGGTLTNKINSINDITLSQAQVVGDNYTVVRQQANTGNGFSATLFDSPSDGYYLAIRGSADDLSDPDWTDANINNAFSGVAKNQIIDMLNFYLRLSTSGPVNQYKYEEVTSAATPSQPHYLVDAGSGPVPIPTYAVLTLDSTVTGYGVIDSNTTLTVTGHSLGGHLASAFRLLFPNVVDEAYTFNSAGFIGWSSAEYNDFATLMAQSVPEMTAAPKAFATGWSNTTDVTAPQDLASHVGEHIGGNAFEVAIESPGANNSPGDIIENHAIDRLTDSLAVVDFMATLDPTMTVEKANAIFLTAFNDMALSLEALMNGFAELFSQPAIAIANSDHDAIYTTIKNITTAVNGTTFTIAPTGASIAHLASGTSDAARGYRYALINVLPFAVTSNLANTAAADAKYDDVYSDAFLEDRALMLGAVLERNANDTTHPSLINGEPIYFDDRFGGPDVFAGQTNGGNVNQSDVVNIAFGNANNNTLSGGKKDDRLYGNGGNDTFYGNEGNDYLEGGTGSDTYVFDSTLTGGFGSDTIIDSNGVLNIDGDTTFDVTQIAEGSNVYAVLDANGMPEPDGYRFIVGGEGLTITKASGNGDNNSIFIKGWVSGQFGVTLNNASAQSPDTSGLQVIDASNRANNHPDGQVFWNTAELVYPGAGLSVDMANFWDPEIQAFISNGDASVGVYPASDGQPVFAFHGGQLNDVITGTDYIDVLAGKDGDDHLQLGNGVWNFAIGQSGSDYLQGGTGKDYLSTVSLFAADLVGNVGYEADYDAQDAITTRETLIGGAGDDYLSGGRGIETIAGGADNDEIFAGQNNDLVDGGAGNDTIFGDSRGAELGGAFTPTTFSTGQLGIQYIDAATVGVTNDDTLDGGVGNDLILGELGNDIIYGGAGNDQLMGDRGGIQLQWSAGAPVLGSYDLAEALHGDDFIDGGDGDDTIYGNGGNDTLYGGKGLDHIYGDTQSDLEVGNDLLYGGEGNDFLWGYQGADQLFGDAGIDQLLGGDGDDQLYGGADNDVLSGEDGSDTLYGGEGNDDLLGGDSDDVLIGGSGVDRLFGEDGHDTLVGGSGDDILQGGAGNDIYEFSAGGGEDSIIDTQGDNIFRFNGVAVASGLQGIADETVINIHYGNDDIVIIDPADFGYVTLELASGEVILNADVFLGSDYIYGSAGNDQFTGTSISETIVGGLGNDTLAGASGDDTYQFRIGDGSDTITDTQGINTLLFADIANRSDVNATADASSITITYSGADQINLTAEDFSTMRVELSNGIVMTLNDLYDNSEYVYGTSGDDVFSGDSIDEMIFGGLGNDTLRGRNGVDHLRGEEGNDMLEGGNGDDYLEGGSGNDILKGEENNDTYVFSTGDGADSIEDRLGVNTVRFTDINNASNLQATADSSTVTISYGGNDEVTFVSAGGSSLGDALVELSTGEIVDTMSLLSGNTYVYGSAINDVFTGTNLGERLYGGYGNDELNGGDGYDRIYGGVGDDTLNGGGDGALYGEEGDDILRNSGTLSGGVGSDTYEWGLGDRITTFIYNTDTGSNRHDVLRFLEDVDVADVAISRSDDDLLLQVESVDKSIYINQFFIDGVAQIDSVRAINAIEFVSDGTVWDTDAIMTLVQTPTDGNNEIYGSAGSDTIDGLGGNDTLYGFEGIDTLVGGEGDDNLYGGEGNDHLIAGGGRDELYGNEGEDELVGGEGSNDLFGGTGDDILRGGSGDELLGGEDNDIYEFGLGDGSVDINNHFQANAGDHDVLRFLSGINPGDISFEILGSSVQLNINGSSGDAVFLNSYISNHQHAIDAIEFTDGTVWDTSIINGFLLQATESDDVISGFDSDDTINGLGGNDTISGYYGNDTLSGNQGDDEIYGGDNNDTLYGNEDNDIINGGEGDDELYGGDGQDILIGDSSDYPDNNVNPTFSGFGHDTLYGGDDHDELYGGLGNDILHGGDGNDTLNGGFNTFYTDTLRGGKGSDTYLYGKSDSNIIIETDLNNDLGGADKILFDLTISQDDIQVSRELNDLYLDLFENSQSSARITVKSFFSSEVTPEAVLNKVQFSNGEFWTAAQLADMASIPTTAVEDILSAGFNQSIIITVADLLANDIGDGTLSIINASIAANGSIVFDSMAQTITFTPNSNFSGAATFNYDLFDGTTTVTGLVTVNVANFQLGDTLHDELGQEVFSVDASGIVTEHRYHTDGSLAETLTYSHSITTQLADWLATHPGETPSDADLAGLVHAANAPGLYDNLLVNGDAHYSIDPDQWTAGLLWQRSDTADRRFQGVIPEGETYSSLLLQTVDVSGFDLSGDMQLSIAGRRGVMGAASTRWRVDFLDSNNAVIESTVLMASILEFGLEQASGSIPVDAVQATLFLDGYVPGLKGPGMATEDIVLEFDDLGIYVHEGEFDSSLANNELLLSDHTVYHTAEDDAGDSYASRATNQVDTIEGDAADNTIKGLDGNDTLYGGEGDDELWGGEGSDTLRGGLGNDVLKGGLGDDTLNGRLDDDHLYGNKGNDTLVGAAGSDVYHFAPGDGQDAIYNALGAQAGDVDQLIFSETDLQSLWFSRSGDDLLIDHLGSTDRVTVDNWYVGHAQKLDVIHVSDGLLLMNQVDTLVNAMAAFNTGEPATITTIAEANDPYLNTALITAWS